MENIAKNVQVSQFADDIEIYCKIARLERSKNAIEKAILKIKSNLRTLGLELCARKTVLIHFNNTKQNPGETQIQIDGTVIKSSECTCFLGIMFDYKLSFNQHITQLQKKYSETINIIKFLSGTWWGVDPTTLITLYTSYIRSQIDYGLFTYFPKCKKDIQILEKIQFAVLRRALGHRNSTPTNITIEESKLTYIQDRAKFLCHNFLIKAVSNTSLIVNQNIPKFFKKHKRKKRKRKRIIQ